MDEFVLRYGAPYSAINLNSGDIAYVWNSGITSLTMPATATTEISGNTAYTQVYGGGAINMQCEVQLVVDAEGTIKSVRILKDTIGAWATSRCHEVLS